MYTNIVVKSEKYRYGLTFGHNASSRRRVMARVASTWWLRNVNIKI